MPSLMGQSRTRSCGVGHSQWRGKTTPIPNDPDFRPVETEGEWLKIRWDAGAPTGKPKPDASGWIRWKKAGVLQIDFSYFA